MYVYGSRQHQFWSVNNFLSISLADSVGPKTIFAVSDLAAAAAAPSGGQRRDFDEDGVGGSSPERRERERGGGEREGRKK